jgi:TPR repeat protein
MRYESVLRRSLFCAVVVTSLFPLGPAWSASHTDKPVFGNSGFEIPEADQPKLEKMARSGDQDAALRLAAYYTWSFGAESGRVRKFYWLQIAAENGSPMGEYNLGFALSLGGPSQDLTRARFWLKKAHRDGVSPAASVLHDLGVGP